MSRSSIARRTLLLVLAIFVASSASAADLLTFPSGESIDVRTYRLSPADLKAAKASADATRKKIVDEWGENEENWLELSGTDEVAYVGALGKFRNLKKTHPSLKESLELSELIAIANYSAWGYQWINRALWKGDWGEQAASGELEVKTLLSALNKLPDFKAMVYRSEFSPNRVEPGSDLLGLAKKRFDTLEVAGPGVSDARSKIAVKAFWSSTKGIGQSARETYLENAALLFKIRSSTGRDITELSDGREHEEEVMFLPGSEFLVRKKEIVKRTPTQDYPYAVQYVVELEEQVRR